MWSQTAATTYLLQPWNSAPLTGSPPEAIAAKPRAGKAFALVLPRICVPGIRSAQRFSFNSTSPLPSVYPPRFYYRKSGHIFNNIPLHRAFSFHLPDGSFFAPNKRIFCHASYPARSFSGTAISYQLSYSRPILERNPEPIVRHGSRGERRFWWLYKPSVVRYGGILSA